ncbi:MAG: FAD-binding oxidoreductase, partial [Candidatus Helarchaeales archaeon]
AVIEPYVTGAQLQAELLKHGLNCHMPGAGPQVSPLASATSMCGPGFTSSETGFSGRNVLGTEWVLPTGEILRLGALGMTNEPDWFHGDGPGPSLRGIMRGFVGTKSGLGVFTKVAIRLFPFPCEPTIFQKIKGTTPRYELEEIKLMRYHIFNLNNYDDLEKALLRIAEEEIAFMVFHASAFAIMCIFSCTKEEMFKNISMNPRLKYPILVMIVARTQREFDYKEKALAAIVEELGLKDITTLPGRKRFTPPNISYAEALRSAVGMHGFLATGAFQSTHGAMDTLNFAKHIMQANIPVKRKYIKKGLLADDKGEGVWTESFEHGHFFHAEMPTMYDQTNRNSIKGMADYLMECNKLDLEERLGIPFFIEGDKMHDWYGPQCSNYHVWLRKIKELFDPNCAADPGFYISAKK